MNHTSTASDDYRRERERADEEADKRERDERYAGIDFVAEREAMDALKAKLATLTLTERQKAVESSGTTQNSRLSELERAYEAFTWGRGPWSGDMAYELTQLRNRRNNA